MIFNSNFDITVPADGLAPDGARPSADTVMSTNYSCSFQSFTGYWWSWMTWRHKMSFKLGDGISRNLVTLEIFLNTPGTYDVLKKGNCKTSLYQSSAYLILIKDHFMTENLIDSIEVNGVTDAMAPTLHQNPSTDHVVSHLYLTHWGRVTHICVGKLTISGSDNGLSPGRRQAIIWTNAGILLIGPIGTDFSEILTEIYTFSFRKMHLKMSSAKWRPYCHSLNVLTHCGQDKWSQFCRQHFKMGFLNGYKGIGLKSIAVLFFLVGQNDSLCCWNWFNGLSPVWRHAITWNKDDPQGITRSQWVKCATLTSYASSSLITWKLVDLEVTQGVTEQGSQSLNWGDKTF